MTPVHVHVCMHVHMVGYVSLLTQGTSECASEKELAHSWGIECYFVYQDTLWFDLIPCIT